MSKVVYIKLDVNLQMRDSVASELTPSEIAGRVKAMLEQESAFYGFWFEMDGDVEVEVNEVAGHRDDGSPW